MLNRFFTREKKAAAPEKKINESIKNIHLIWFGSELRPQHVERIIQWKKLNPHREVIVVCDSEFENAIQKQLADTGIIVKTKAKVPVSKNVNNFIEKLISPREDKSPPNWAAASDIYRMCLLHQYGGWYVDTDIIPINLDQHTIHEKFNLKINSTRDRLGAITSLSPSVIVSAPNTPFTQLALELIELMSTTIKEKEIDLIRSHLASVRMLATQNSTGVIVRGVLCKLCINGTPIIKDMRYVGEDFKLYDSIATEFKSRFEQSWILEKTTKRGGQRKYIPITGLEIDDNYTDALMHGEINDLSILPIFDFREKICNKLPNKHVVTAPDTQPKSKFRLC